MQISMTQLATCHADGVNLLRTNKNSGETGEKKKRTKRASCSNERFQFRRMFYKCNQFVLI